MKEFQFYLSTAVDFGCGKIKNLRNYIKQYNAKNVIVVTDKNLQEIGLLEPIIEELQKCDVLYKIFNKVEPNPEIHIIDEGAAFAKKESSNMIIAVGGGSSIDTGKGISIMAVNEGSVYDYLDGRGENKKEIKNQPIPLIAIPTTSGTGSEVSMYSVITDENTRIKDSLTSVLIYPKVAIVDPEMTIKLPPRVTAHTGLDVLGHALEAYTSSIQNPLTNVWALEAIKLVFENLPEAVSKNTIQSRENMAFASVMAGSAMSHCGATIPHGLGCPLSGHCNLPHGLTVGILQIPMIEYNKEVLKDKFLDVVKYVNPTIEISENMAADKLIEMIKDLFVKISVEETLDKKLIDEETIKAMVKDAAIHGCTGLNIVPLNNENIQGIYNKVIQ
ncbi:alcohol dehydrogenase/alcohol dehydrogenase [Clostridium amylolyticum]|uniref:Alcohol dehydrogenase/alcohol dehydrogenase n=1 Tax=Clostridium amylolyticum TaxID=1121298 RepID=A0A1M6N0J6_9CLOT|nr:iron-containing alcohol dehydrogenase [Clostridium amylolyticum]SHJ89126.1 alcohol dehydrogenase/alcohol dehydrogenase [Clostridium amylolyticum]